MRQKMSSKFIIILGFMLMVTNMGLTQDVNIPNDGLVDTKNSGEFKIVPYLNYSRTIGFGFGLIPMYSFNTSKTDHISPKSVIGLSGIYTTNKSYAVGLFGNMFFKEDKWRLQYGLGFADYNFQTYYAPIVGEGFFYDYTTKIKFGTVNVKREVGKNLYLGLGYAYEHLITKFDIAEPNDTTVINQLQFIGLHDSRDNVNYPKDGMLLMVKFNYMPTWMSNVDNTQIIIVNLNKYIAVHGNRDVVALRFHTKSGLKNVNFQQQPVLGGVDLRGYSSGKYRGDGVLDLQGEYRWNFPNKLNLSVVGFAGIGTLYGSENETFDWKLYPSIGAGVRWTVLTSSHINIGTDVGFGKDDWGIYFRFNEAF